MSFKKLKTMNDTLCDETRKIKLKLFVMRVYIKIVKVENVIYLMYVNKSRKTFCKNVKFLLKKSR